MDAILKIDISPYLSRESSEFDEIWYADANFDSGDGLCLPVLRCFCTLSPRRSVLVVSTYQVIGQKASSEETSSKSIRLSPQRPAVRSVTLNLANFSEVAKEVTKDSK